MRIPRVYTAQSLAVDTNVSVTGQPALHISRVLRMRTGAELRLFNGDGREYAATITGRTRDGVSVQLGTAVDTLAEPALSIHLAQGITRTDRMDLILQKSVELGVGTIQPLWMQRSQHHLRGERLEKRIRHWQGVIASACEQCGRATLPALLEPVNGMDWIRTGSANGMKLILQADSRETLADLAAPDDNVTLLVGPEGGMNNDERTFALAAGFTGVRLGQRILRTETAALAAVAGIQTLWGDFR